MKKYLPLLIVPVVLLLMAALPGGLIRSETSSETATNITVTSVLTIPKTEAKTVRFGTWKGPARPRFTAEDFTRPSQNFELLFAGSPKSANGSYLIAPAFGTAPVRPVIWIADRSARGMPVFKVGGTPFPIVLDPSPISPFQKLSIDGVMGNVYKSYNTISGGMIIDVTGALP